MPLTKPECLDCGYSLRGIQFGDMCPECGCVERKLLFDGSSKALTACMLVATLILVVSYAVIIASKAHLILMPQFKASWVLDTTYMLRKTLIPTLFVSGGCVGLTSYVILVLSNLNHNMNRVRSMQMIICLCLSMISLLSAVLWLI